MGAGRRANRWPLLGLLGLLAIVAAAYLLGGTGNTRSSTVVDASDPSSGLAVVELADLPPEAADTLGLIEAGGPYPYERDGATFGNREQLLPQADAGYYREYTVSTPGEDDRGARRIVTGRDGELYFSADHYASFVRIRAP